MKKVISVGIILAIAYFGSGRILLSDRICITEGLCWRFGTAVNIRKETDKNFQ